MHQIITYNEYLPALLGKKYTKRYNLDLANSGYFYGYDASVDASVANEFTTAAFRFGHSMIFDQLSRPSNDWSDEQSPLELKAFVFNPLEYVNQNGSQVEPVLRGLVVDPSLMADTTFPSSMKEFLFAEADKYGKDLLAINIQRGRDHGLRGYNDYREFFGLQRAADFDELLEIPSEMRHTLSGLYEHVDDIDLYVGGLAETPVSGGTVGPTFAHMMAAQFRDLKVGDRFYFENGGCETTFTPEQLTELRKITLSSLICTCTDTVDIQKMPFYFATEDSESSPNRNANPRIPCSEIHNLDLSAWQQPYRNADDIDGVPDSGVWTAWVPAYGNPPSLDLDVLHRERPTGICLNAIGAEMRMLETGDPQMRFMCPAGAISHSDVPPACLDRGRWTNWIDSSNPISGTDSELLKDLRKLRAGEICEHPIHIQAQTVHDNTPAGETGDVFATLDPVRGLLCRGEDQIGGTCADYKVRFFCPPDNLDLDLEMEIVLAYQTESRKVITSVATLIDEEDEDIFSFNDFAWTGWYNSDSPSLDDDLHGDNESLMRARATAEICANPVAIEAVRAIDGVDALSTGDVFKFFSPRKGLLCEDSDQTTGYKCDDYKVRYLCPQETILAAPLAPAQGPKETYRWALTQSEKLCDDYKVCCHV
ncbi:unnamed protein product [Oikopleura dioica]|uniref:WxxW domain-containing protein n=1 Tax=Oikopleura dioica TaxID=34765 RepID=E4WT44_OIKDI|nr:unnamed protein product [Oikopleura dioica]